MAESRDTVTVRLYAGFEQRARERRPRFELEPDEAPTVRDLRVARGSAKGATGIALANGVHAVGEPVSRGGDEVALFPPLGGG